MTELQIVKDLLKVIVTLMNLSHLKEHNTILYYEIKDTCVNLLAKLNFDAETIWLDKPSAGEPHGTK